MDKIGQIFLESLIKNGIEEDINIEYKKQMINNKIITKKIISNFSIYCSSKEHKGGSFGKNNLIIISGGRSHRWMLII